MANGGDGYRTSTAERPLDIMDQVTADYIASTRRSVLDPGSRRVYDHRGDSLPSADAIEEMNGAGWPAEQAGRPAAVAIRHGLGPDRHARLP
jgi:hypothetical protein